MAGDILVFNPFHQITQAIGRGVQIRVVDLFRVSGEDDLAAPAHPGKDGLDHMGAEILAFIANNELAGDAAAPDIG